MWAAIVGAALVLAVLSIVYLISRFAKFGVARKLAGDRPRMRFLYASLPLVVFVVCCFFDLVDSVIVLLHLAAFWLIADIVTAIGRKLIRKRNGSENEAPAQKEPRVYVKGIIVLAFCAIYLVIGAVQAYHVSRTSYAFSTSKELPGGKLRVALIADSHVGVTFDAEGLEKELKRIEAEKPDILVVAGDFVDDGTTREDMIASCRALGSVKTTYGVYFAYGNHDKGYYSNRPYTAAELDAELRANGVIVLEDEAVLVADSFYVIGRMDKSESSRRKMSESIGTSKDGVKGSGERKSIEELLADLDRSRFILVLNHQPNDYEAESGAGVDLVLSGHTHGGQLLPLGPIGRLIGANDRTYGTERRGGTQFVVTSGISDWEIRFKTGAHSEYVIIDITSE